ncbi:MAG: protein translocase subunit SecF [Gammaproteobacteria bacterium]|nr:protein translocase subunit SecF [Gammaproteobacteria bacterium]
MANKEHKPFDFDFMGKVKPAVALTTLLVIISVGASIFKGFNFGVDFTGGTLVELGYQSEPDLNQIRETLAASEFKNATVQRFGTPTDVLVRLPPTGDQKASAVSQRVVELLPGAALRRIEFVGPQVGDELAESGVMALLFALGGIFLYVALRFTWKFSVGAIVATMHDVVITIGYFAVTGREFDLTVLAAVLAVLGYSLNDTVVVFDRVRENLRKMRKGEVKEVVNLALNQTLSRTLMTSGETMLAVLALLFFGGELLHGFSIALVIGIVIGTYSSIYVATATVVALGISRQDMLPVQKEGAAVDDRP